MPNDDDNRDNPLELPPGATLFGGRASLIAKSNGSRIQIAPMQQQHQQQLHLQQKQQLQQKQSCHLLVGRQMASADIRVPHKSVSRKNSILFYMDQLLMLQDLGGKHGTHINGERIHGTRALQHGDVIVFGQPNVHESTFTVDYLIINDTTTPTTVETTVETKLPNNSTNDQERPDPLAGLSGRARREAEISQMMATLEETPTYQTYPNQNADNDIIMEPIKELTIAQTYQLPLTNRFTIPNNGTTTSITSLAVDPSGSRFAMGAKHLELFDFSSLDQHRQTPFKTLDVETGYHVVDVAYSNTGDRIVVGTGSVSPRILGRDGELLLEFMRGDMYVTDMAKTTGHIASITGVTWHPLERDIVLTASIDGSARLWNLLGKTQFHKLVCDKVYRAKNSRGQRTGVTSIAFHPGGREFAIGTVCGSIQIWNATRVGARPERAVFDDSGSLTSLVYNHDGSKLATRCSNATILKVWDSQKLSQSNKPICTLAGLPSEHERANCAFSPDGKFIIAGTSEYMKAEDGKRNEKGSLQVFKLPVQPVTQSILSILELDMNIGVVLVQWHPKINQIFVACSDGSAVVWYDDRWSKKGALISSAKAGRAQDSLSELLKSRAPTGSAGISGEIITPLYQPGGHKRKRNGNDDTNKSRAPQPPVSGKYKIGSQSGTSVTLQQFVANSSINQNKVIAGKDPREELFKFNTGKSFVRQSYDTEGHLAEKTVEQEEDEANTKN